MCSKLGDLPITPYNQVTRILVALMALTNVACARAVDVALGTEGASLSTSGVANEPSTFELNPAGALGDEESIDVGPPDVTDNTILEGWLGSWPGFHCHG